MTWRKRSRDYPRAGTAGEAVKAAALVAGTVVFFVACFYAWRWAEAYRASIWAAEMRKAGVAAPVEAR